MNQTELKQVLFPSLDEYVNVFSSAPPNGLYVCRRNFHCESTRAFKLRMLKFMLRQPFKWKIVDELLSMVALARRANTVDSRPDARQTPSNILFCVGFFLKLLASFSCPCSFYLSHICNKNKILYFFYKFLLLFNHISDMGARISFIAIVLVWQNRQGAHISIFFLSCFIDESKRGGGGEEEVEIGERRTARWKKRKIETQVIHVAQAFVLFQCFTCFMLFSCLSSSISFIKFIETFHYIPHIYHVLVCL